MKKTQDRPHLTLGRNIKARRSALGLSPELLAERAGMGVSGLKDIERGVSEGSYRNRKALTGVLACSMADLYREQSDRGTIPDLSTAADLLSRFANAPPDIQMVIMTILTKDVSFLALASGKSQRLARELLQAVQSS